MREEKQRTPLDANELKYCNEYGGFSKDGTEYHIRVNKEERLPTVWSNIMANENFGTVVTEGMGGYVWYKNSRLRKTLTAWNNNQVTDVPSEIIYLEDMESKKYMVFRSKTLHQIIMITILLMDLDIANICTQVMEFCRN